MATNFPNLIDTFTNPVATKTDDVDLVQAAHINDPQDSIRAIERWLITPGTIYEWGLVSIPDDKSIVQVVGIFDGLINTVTSDLAAHLAYELVTDPAQHKATVISVVPTGNLASTRVQPALEELQGDIDDIYGGGLDGLYLESSGNQVLTGDFTADNLFTDGSLIINSLVTLDDASLSTLGPIFKLDLDSNSNDAGERFLVTRHGDTGGVPSSANLLFEVTGNSTILTGDHLLKEGVQETGYFGLRVYVAAGEEGSAFYGAGVNFKTVMSNVPASITLTPTSSTNIQDLAVVDIDEYGFMFEFAGTASGLAEVYGNYTTVGN